MRGIRYDVTGPGWTRAVNEAIRARARLVVVHDSEPSGVLIRVGYYLEQTAAKAEAEPSITWFSKDEIRVRAVAVSEVPLDVKGRVEVLFRHPREDERHFMFDFPLGAEYTLLVRCVFRCRGQRLKDFMIQAEIRRMIGGRAVSRPAVRYDSAHGFIHRDKISIKGKKTKEKLAASSLEQSVEVAMDEIRTLLPTWLPELGYPSLDPALFETPVAASDFDRAKADLMALLQNPEAGASMTESRLVELR